METSQPAANAPQSDHSSEMFTRPQKEHVWLQQLIGNWTSESEFKGDPNQPPMKSRGTESVRSLGGLWIVAEGEAEMPGGTKGQMMLTVGFDPKRNRWIGTWIGSMASHLWIYDGELDASERILTLNAEGPSFTDPNKLAKYQDIIEIKDPDYRTLSSRYLGDDGKWTHFMTAHYRRTK